MSSLLRPVRLLLLGAPGAGKGTQSSRILRDFPQIHSISSGDLLRQQIKDQTQIGKEAEKIIKSGGLLPDESIVSLIKNELESKSFLNQNSSWLLDGFPRTFAQAGALDKTLAAHDSSINLVIQLDVPEEVILDRIRNRYVHVPSGRIYNLTFNPPKVPGKDDVTGEPLSKRPDDNPEVFKKRIDDYHHLTMPLVDYYDKFGIVRTIKGETSDIIYPQVKELLLKEFKK